MLRFEQEAWSKGYQMIAGIDEAGRGPLAGPVVAAAVILPKDFSLPGINDSKQLPEKKRDEYFGIIKEKALACAWSEVDNHTIDKINILKASLLAMSLAISRLSQEPDFILVDGNQEIMIDLPQMAVVKGDCLSCSIAAASIVAKVVRDGIMNGFHQKFPEYGFDKHKGYATREHLEKLEKHGHCEIHRTTFRGVLPKYDLFEFYQVERDGK